MPGESMSGLWLRFYCLRCFKKRQSGGIREMSRERDVSPKFRLLAEGGGAAEEGRVIAAKIMSLTKRCFRCFHRASYAASDGASPSHCSKHRLTKATSQPTSLLPSTCLPLVDADPLCTGPWDTEMSQTPRKSVLSRDAALTQSTPARTARGPCTASVTGLCCNTQSLTIRSRMSQ